MKDSRYTELLNLYIDRQITAEETAELEAEIQASPRRRALYRQYCQMHQATKSVYESFRAHAADPQSGQPAGRGVIANFEHQRRHRGYGWVHVAGGLAAAACLTLAYIRYNAPLTPDTPTQDTVAKTEALPTAEQVLAVAEEKPAGPLSLRNQTVVEPNYQEMLRIMREEDKRAYESGQLAANRVSSLFDDGVFDSPQILPNSNPRVFHGKQKLVKAGELEFTAYEFRH